MFTSKRIYSLYKVETAKGEFKYLYLKINNRVHNI